MHPENVFTFSDDENIYEEGICYYYLRLVRSIWLAFFLAPILQN